MVFLILKHPALCCLVLQKHAVAGSDCELGGEVWQLILTGQLSWDQIFTVEHNEAPSLE